MSDDRNLRDLAVIRRWVFALLALSCMLMTMTARAQNYSGVWWEPAKSGQGVTLLQEGDVIGGSWYLYDDTGSGLWLTFVGKLTGTTLTTDFLRFSGPPLGTDWDPALVVSSAAGTATLNFTSPTAARLDYAVDGNTGSLQLEPFDFSGGGQPEGQYAGTWYDPQRSGQGITLSHRGNRVAGAWYLYDNSGMSIWATFTGELAGNTLSVPLLSFSGPPLGSTWDPNLVQSFEVGTGNFTFSSAQNASLNLSLSGISSSLSLGRFSFGAAPTPDPGPGPAPTECANIAGIWKGTENVTLSCAIDGGTLNRSVSETGVFEITQNGCAITYRVPGFNFSRNGTISGNSVTLSGEFAQPILDGASFTANTVAINGTVQGDALSLSGSGTARGVASGQPFTCSGNSNSSLTRGNTSDLGPCAEQAGLYVGTYKESYCDGERVSGQISVVVKANDCSAVATTEEDTTLIGTIRDGRIDAQRQDEECGTTTIDATISGRSLDGTYSYSKGGGGSFEATRQ